LQAETLRGENAYKCPCCSVRAGVGLSVSIM
jgi:hypothetical protein